MPQRLSFLKKHTGLQQMVSSEAGSFLLNFLQNCRSAATRQKLGRRYNKGAGIVNAAVMSAQHDLRNKQTGPPAPRSTSESDECACQKQGKPNSRLQTVVLDNSAGSCNAHIMQSLSQQQGAH